MRRFLSRELVLPKPYNVFLFLFINVFCLLTRVEVKNV